MSITLTALMKQRRDTAANWTTANPTLLAGEIGIESDTLKWKVGNGTAAWNSLAYIPGLSISAYPLVNADIASNAEIAVSKLADGAARQLLQTDAAGTGVEWASNIDIPGTLDVTGAATFDAAVTVQGDLTVNGTTTTIDTANLAIEDKNIEIGKVASPTDVTADGGGITLKGTTDKTINWVDATDAWTFSEHVDIASGKEYRINGVKVLDGTSLGSSVLITSANIVDGTIVNADINASAAIAGTKITAASTTAVGTVQLEDSTSSTSTTKAATPNSVKSAYDLADAALPKAGGTLTGDVTLDNQSDLRFGEATANGSNYVAFQAPASITADVTWTLPAADGSSGQVLSTDGSGTLSFATPPSATGVSLGLVIALS
jgi:hypothetical protein